MRAKLLTAVIAGLLVVGCGGGGDNGNATASVNPADSSGANPTGTGTGTAPAADTPISSSGTQYLNEAAQTSQSQAQQSQIVVQKSSNPQVQILAQQLNNEINIINQQITQISQTNNVTINNNVTNQQQTQINNINTLSGNELDRTYVAGLVDSWKSLLAATLLQARQETNVQLRQTATANVLLIEQRLAVAEEILCLLQPTAYLMDAYEDGLLEIQLGQLALEKATNEQVRQFAQRMIDDHTQMNSRVTTLAQQKNVTLPSALSAEQQEIVTQVSSFSGADFDRVYMDRNVLVHAKAVNKTSVVSQQGTDAEVKALATQSLPILQAHLQSAQSIAATLQASQLYQLAQGLTTEIQILQLALTNSTDTRIKTLAQQILTEDRTTYSQLVQLARQKNETIPLVIPPGRVQAVQQLVRTRSADVDSQLLNLFSAHTTESLQIAQSAQTSNDADISAFATTRASILQARLTQLTGDSASADSSNAGSDAANTGTTDTGITGTNTTGIGTPGIDTTGIGTPGIGTTGIGTTGIGTTGTGTIGTGITSTNTTDIGTPSIGTTGTGITGTGTTGIGTTTGTGTTTGIGTTGTGITGTDTTTGIGTTGTDITGTGITGTGI